MGIMGSGRVGCPPGQTVPGGVLLERTGSYDRGARHDPCVLQLGLAYQGWGGTELDENNNFMNSLAGLFVRMPHSWSGTAGRAISGVARLLAACLLLASFPLQAAVIVVSSVSDGLVFGDGCGLREALINANTDSRAGSLECEAGNGHDTIILPAVEVSLASNMLDETDPTTGDLDVSSDVTILGGLPWSVINAGQRGRIFDVAPGASLTVKGVVLQAGSTNTEGGALRVGAGANVQMEDSRVILALISSLVTGGRGASIYAAPGSSLSVARSEISFAQALGTGSRGAGVYCDDCRLVLSATTLSNNKVADIGGSLFVSGGGSASLEFVTIGHSQGAAGAGAYIDGALQLLGVVIADNGSGLVGSDLLCGSGAVLSARHSFAEKPDGCGVHPADELLDRTGISLNGDSFLYGVGTSVYGSLPSSAHALIEVFYPYLSGVVPGADCLPGGDQHGRRLAFGNCNMGASAIRMFGASPMSFQIDSDASPITVYFGMQMAPNEATTVRVSRRDNGNGNLGGIGESCDYPDQEFVFAAGENQKAWSVDPRLLFDDVSLVRRYRVCEFDVEVVSGDPAWVGARAGIVRINWRDKVSTSASGVSTPGHGQYLDFGVVPYGSGALRPIVFRNPASPSWSLTSVVIDGPDADRFELVTPLPLAMGPGTSANLDFRCKPGRFGDFFARVSAATTNPSFAGLVYGLKCTVAHQVSVTRITDEVSEADSPSVARFMLLLDSPNVLDVFTVEVADADGSATPGIDYESAARFVTFAPGVTAVPLDLPVYDDEIIEVNETIQIRLVGASDPQVALGHPATASVLIRDDDLFSRSMTLDIDMPAAISAGAVQPVVLTMTNTGATIISKASFEMSVHFPVRILSFVNPAPAPAAVCNIASGARGATCSFSGVLVRPGETLTVEALLQFAEMNDAPQMDVRTSLEVGLKALMVGDVDGPDGPAAPASEEVAIRETRDVLIDGIGATGGGSVSFTGLLVLLLLASRRWGCKRSPV